MKQRTISLYTIGLAIFTMLFGAGNIIYPIRAGVQSGSHVGIGILGFLLTGVVLPIIGLVAMILFDGDFKTFFYRAGKIPGFLAILFCMLIIGPFIVMPRCITVPYDLLYPFLPNISLPIFSLLFCIITFIFTYKESKMLDILGKYMSPILIGSLGLIITLGLFGAHTIPTQAKTASEVFTQQIVHGFQTLDLLGAIFFAYIIVKLIRSNDFYTSLNCKQIALLCLKGSMVTAILMASFYIGFMMLGAYYAHLVTPDMNGAEIFRTIAFHIVGPRGIFLLVIAVLVTCLSTITALAAVFAEYARTEIFHNKISYVQSLLIGLGITTLISNVGLTNILTWSAPIITMGYPIIVMITLCNIAYKLFNFTWIKLPVFATTAVMISMYTYPLMK